MKPSISKVATVGALTLISLIGIQAISSLTPAIGQTVASLARYLTQSGAKLYGASWCPYTQRQRQLFGSAIGEVRYIECYPNGRNGGVNRQCVERGIQGYPTWEIGGRQYSSLISLEQLAQISGFYRASMTNNLAKSCDDRADEIFYRRHPELAGQRISQSQVNLAREWLRIRRSLNCQ